MRLLEGWLLGELQVELEGWRDRGPLVGERKE